MAQKRIETLRTRHVHCGLHRRCTVAFHPFDGNAFTREQAFVIGHKLRQSLKWRR